MIKIVALTRRRKIGDVARHETKNGRLAGFGIVFEESRRIARKHRGAEIERQLRIGAGEGAQQPFAEEAGAARDEKPGAAQLAPLAGRLLHDGGQIRGRQGKVGFLSFAHPRQIELILKMIAPEVRQGSNRETERRVLLRNNLLVTLAIFIALQIWRPHFFLTDDNLDGGYPFFYEVGRHLLAGQSPFVSDHLFGGNYDLLSDPGFFAWHPLYLLVSLLAGTPLHLWIIDLDALALYLLATAGFVNLAWYLRRELALTISDGWIMFYTASFTYSMIALTTGSSWLTFMADESALPWLALGILQRSWWRGAGLIAVFTLHQVLGGHPQPTIFNTLFLSLFALGLSWSRRSWQPLGMWTAGYAAAVMVMLPFIVPMLQGFLSSPRSHGVELSDMQGNNIPPELFPTSLFFGMALWIINPPIHPYTTYTLALSSCAAAWCILPALVSYAKWRELDRVLLVVLVVLAIFICRPFWLTVILSWIPLLKSMRWPFREMIQFQFFFHLLLVVRTPGLSSRVRFRFAAWSVVVLVVPLLFYRLPPTFNAMQMDRQLLFSGGFERYWSQVRPLFQPDDRLAVLIPIELYTDDRFEEPYSLLSTYNYSCLTGVINTWGWSQTPPSNRLYTRTPAMYPFGAYLPSQKAALLAERPALKFLTLESLKPLKITLSSRDGPTIDLTPFIPEATKNFPAELRTRPWKPPLGK